MAEASGPRLARTGVAGLDDVLEGGLTAERVYLVQGSPGTGKTTLAIQFLLEGIERGETALYVSLAETWPEFESVAASHGWDLGREGFSFFQFDTATEPIGMDVQYTMFHPSEVELSKTTQDVLAEIERLDPDRIVFDSLAEIRMLAQDPLRFRRQVMALKDFFVRRNCTVLLLDDATEDPTPRSLHSLVHGVLQLSQTAREYGGDRRRLRVVKMRGRTFREGFHDFEIERGGLQVYPRLVAAEHAPAGPRGRCSSGVPELDAMLRGGLVRGTGTMLLGPTGTGKSIVSTHFLHAAAERGETAIAFTFDERRGTYLDRAAGIGRDLRPFLDDGRLVVRQVDPAQLSPGEFESEVRGAVAAGATLVVIDSLNGYLNAMVNERALLMQLHEMLTYLGRSGVTTILIVTQPGLLGEDAEMPVNASYLVDTVVLLRYFEAEGRVRKAISVLKNRNGPHDQSIRELHLGTDDETFRIGAHLHELQGVLQGVPVFRDNTVVDG